MPDMLIETQIDQLAKLVSERKKISVSECAKILKTNETQIEEWVRILEENGFVEMIYPALGEPIIILKKLDVGEALKKKEQIEDKKEQIEDKTKDFQRKVEKIEKSIKSRDEDFSKIETELKRKLNTLEKNLKIADRLEVKKQDVIKKTEEVKSIADSVVREIDDIHNDISQMENKINDHIKAMEEHETDIKGLKKDKEEIENEITGLESQIRLVKIIVKRPIKIPILSLKSIFLKHKQKTENISKKREKLHKRALKIKNILKNKKENIGNKA